METNFILERYIDLHERTIPVFINSFLKQSERIETKLNPIGWILWHMIRGEDFGLNRLLNDSQQLYFVNNWNKRLKIQTTCVGTGMTKQEVLEIDKILDIGLLNDYRLEVYESYCTFIKNLDIMCLNNSIESKYLKNLMFNEGLFKGDIDSLFNLYKDKSKGWFLLHTTLTHNYYHIGQISIQLKMYDIQQSIKHPTANTLNK